MSDSPLAHSPTLSAAPGGAGDDSARLPPGTAVGEYVVNRFLGAGAMGEVYAGVHPVIGKAVAIKVLRHELASSAEAAERFIREARAVNQIDHPNVVDVFAFGRLADGRLYLVMDLVDGRTLRAALADAPYPIGKALEILTPVADALDAAHGRGVVHRDLKPDNIMMSGGMPIDGDSSTSLTQAPLRVFVLDFGIAKLVSKANEGKLGNGTLTGQGTWLGTPAYMAPEQWSNDGAGPASDRYALGVIAFELLAGSMPFSASSVPGMMEQHFRAVVPSLATRGLASSAVDDVLRRALAKDPEARYAKARELIAALRVAAGPALGAIVAPETRRPWLPAIAAIGVLGIGIAGVIVARGGSHDAPQPAAVDPEIAAPAGTIAIDVTSVPDHALLTVGDHLVGATPHAIHVQPNTPIELTVRKPGYLPDHRTLTSGASDSAIAVALGEVTRFKGVWKLPNGELRAFDRNADQVDVFKLDEVAGARRFYKHYPFVDATAGIAFAADDEVVDPRAPADPNCHVPVHVEYRYDAAADRLELRRPKITFDDPCVARSHDVEAAVLVRVDGGHDAVEVLAPAGSPVKLLPSPFSTKSSSGNRAKLPPPKLGKTKVLPLEPNPAQKQSNNAFDTVGKKPTSPYTTTKSKSVENIQEDNANQAQILPPPQAALPIQTAEPEQQQAVKK